MIFLQFTLKNKEKWYPIRLKRTEKQTEYYKNPDDDPRGPWNSAAYTCNKSKTQRPNLYYAIKNPNTGELIYPKETAVWAYSQQEHQRNVEQKLIYWGKEGDSKSPRRKQFLSEAGKIVARNVWLYSDARKVCSRIYLRNS